MWDMWVLAAAGLAAAIGGTAALRWWYRWMFVDSDAPPAPDDVVLLAEAETGAEAEVMRGKLEGFGITVLVKNVDSYPHVSLPELHVRWRDVPRAREVLGLDEPPG